MKKPQTVNFKKLFSPKGNTWQHWTAYCLNWAAWVFIFYFSFHKPENIELRYLPFACFVTGYILLKQWYNVIVSSVFSAIIATVWIEYGTFAMSCTTLALLPVVIIISVIRYKYLKKKEKQISQV